MYAACIPRSMHWQLKTQTLSRQSGHTYLAVADIAVVGNRLAADSNPGAGSLLVGGIRPVGGSLPAEGNPVGGNLVGGKLPVEGTLAADSLVGGSPHARILVEPQGTLADIPLAAAGCTLPAVCRLADTRAVCCTPAVCPQALFPCKHPS